MSPMQVRIAVGLNLLAACAGVVFFALTAYRLIVVHNLGSLQSPGIGFLFLFGCGAYFFWGRYRYYSGMGRGGGK